MHVDAKQPRLGVGDLAQGLSVHVQHLQEGDQRKACLQHRGHVSQRLQVLLSEVVEHPGRETHRPPQTLDQRLLESGLLRRLREVVAALAGGKELLYISERESPVLARQLDFVEGVALLAQPR